MSFSRAGYLALALAAGLAAPVSATTYNISFSLDYPASVVGSGDFTVAYGATLPTSVDAFGFGFWLPFGEDAPIRYWFEERGGTVLSFSLIDGKPILTGGDVEGGPGKPRLSFSSAGIGFWSVVVGSYVGCPVPEFEDAGDSDNSEVAFEVATLDTTVDGPILCAYNWEGTYTITKQEPEEPSVVPLPATAALLPLGLVALGAIRRRKTG